MKRYFFIGMAALIILLALVLWLQLPASAISSPSSSPASATPVSPPTRADYLLALPVVPPDPTEIPAGLTPEQAAEYAHRLTYRQAGPILPELERLRSEGLIAGFEIRPDLHGVVMKGAASDALERLSRLSGLAALMPHSEASPSTCAVAAAQALPKQVLGLSRLAGERAMRFRVAGVTSQATDPSINLWVRPGSTGNDYSDISGQTTPDTVVTMRILRGGRVIATQSTTSFSDPWGGWYFFAPSWQDCPVSGYTWSLRPGDVVEVTAHGNTVSTVVADLRAWVDPLTNVVAGRTDPGRSVEVRLSYPSSDPCYWYDRPRVTGTDSSGNFSVNFSDLVDFNRSANAVIYARDANGNSTCYVFHAYRIAAGFHHSDFWGYLKPEVDFLATLRRGGDTVSVHSGRSDPTGYYSGYFTDIIRPGDLISVSGGGVNIQYIATDLNVTFDIVANRVNGTTGANRLVQADFQKRDDWGVVRTSCSGGYDCASARAVASGDFAIDTDLDLARGDYAYFYAYDAEGNYQSGERPVPAIFADLTGSGATASLGTSRSAVGPAGGGGGDVGGYWGNPDAGYVTVTLKDSSGTVKGVNSQVWVGSDGIFITYFGNTAPADIIEVTDGTVTETMRVQNLTARLDGDSGHLTGNAPAGHLLAELWDFRREAGGYFSYCSETTVASPYDLTFDGAQVGGQDLATVQSMGPDGHYSRRTVNAFTVWVRKESGYVGGDTETPNTLVTITLWRSGSSIAVYTTTSSVYGYYWADLSGGTLLTITQGDIVQVQTGDGDDASVPIPELTLNTDGVNNRLYGKAPANEPVQTRVWRRGYSREQFVAADGSGHYSASFNGLYWWDCSPVSVGHRCSQPYVYYYNAAGHEISLVGPYPPSVGADIYESDDTSATARAYTGIQSHTFHIGTDTDWVTFTVPQADVDNGVLYRIETFNLGWNMATRVTLYDAGLNGLVEWLGYNDRGRGVSAWWAPPAAGTYYLQISPPNSYYAAHCEAVYDLMILPVRARVYLPLVMRNY